MSFTWDRTNERFISEPRCPWPDCGTEAGIRKAATTTQQLLSWCAACDRPYEAVLLEPHALPGGHGGQPVPWTRRPGAIHCTYTGRPLQRCSPLDWCEQGGGPGRNSSLDDDSGAVFGPPRKDTQLRLEPVWDCNSVDIVGGVLGGGAGGFDDSVSSVSVVHDCVVVVTRRGRLATLDLDSGALKLERPLEWPGGFPTDLTRAVVLAPAIRGTTAVIVAPHEAVFRDIKQELFALEGVPRAAPRSVQPAGTGSVFLGPPLGIDAPPSSPRGPLFCLFEGRLRGEGVDDPRLRFFEASGVEVACCAVEDIARPPVFDSASGCVVWVSTQGFVTLIKSAALVRDAHTGVHVIGGDDVVTLMSDEILALRQSARPTFVLARDRRGHSELFVAALGQHDETEIVRASLEPAAIASGEVRWSRRGLGARGELVGLAVGSSSSWAQNAGGQLLAISTDLHVASISKEESSIAYAPKFGHEGASRRGSFDPPLVTSAGVISRVPGYLHLDTQGLDWSDYSRSQIHLEGRYERAGGLALFGRKVFVGVGMGVRCFTITRKTA
ncbi:MAG: hypothetical protein Q8O67_10750 [Deltaproteobacteria bacterium]|nr:hypothetical protein [Deltaproteobacteria bacterium]